MRLFWRFSNTVDLSNFWCRAYINIGIPVFLTRQWKKKRVASMASKNCSLNPIGSPVWAQCLKIAKKSLIFKNSPKWSIFGTFNNLLSTNNVNVARFARKMLNATFSVIFKHCGSKCEKWSMFDCYLASNLAVLLQSVLNYLKIRWPEMELKGLTFRVCDTYLIRFYDLSQRTSVFKRPHTLFWKANLGPKILLLS